MVLGMFLAFSKIGKNSFVAPFEEYFVVHFDTLEHYVNCHCPST